MVEREVVTLGSHQQAVNRWPRSLSGRIAESWDRDLLISVLTGFAAGAVHVVGGADHLVAMAPFSLRRPLQAVKSGMAWGRRPFARGGVARPCCDLF